MMVSDHHGSEPNAALRFKSCYCKMAATRAAAIQVLMQDIPLLKSNIIVNVVKQVMINLKRHVVNPLDGSYNIL